MTKSPFPKLSALWRFVRIGGAGFGTTALSGLAHVAWTDRTAIAMAAVASVEVAYRKKFPSGKLSGEIAALVAAYRQIRSSVDSAPAAAVKAEEANPAGPQVSVDAAAESAAAVAADPLLHASPPNV